MPETSLPVEHLFTFTETVGRGVSTKSGPMGRRAIVPVLTGAVARATLKRDDGELIDEASARQVVQALDGRLGQVLKVT